MKKLILWFLLASLSFFDASAQLCLNSSIVAIAPEFSYSSGTLVQDCEKNISFTVRNTGSSTIYRGIKAYLFNSSGTQVGQLLAHAYSLSPGNTLTLNSNLTAVGTNGAMNGLGGLTTSNPGTYTIRVVSYVYPAGSPWSFDLGNMNYNNSTLISGSGCGGYSNPQTISILSSGISSSPSGASASPSSILQGASTTLSRSGGSLGTGASWVWYSGSCGGTYVGQGSSISVSPSSTRAYYVRAENGCDVSGCASVQVTVTNPPPGTPPNPTAPSSNCGSATISRNGTPPGGVTWYWQGTSCGTSFGQSGSNYTASSSGTYYIRAYNSNTGLWSTGCGSVSVNVTPIPSVSAGSNSPLITGETLNLTANAISGASYSWSGPGWSGSGQNPSRTGVTPSMSGNYCVTATVNGCSSAQSCTNVSITAPTPPGTPANPTAPTVNCNNAVLSRGGTPPTGVTWYWQGTTCGQNTNLGSGATYTASSSGTYYIRAYNSSTNLWSSGCGSVAVSIGQTPSVTAGSTSPLVVGQTLNLTATTISGASYSWTHSSGWSSSLQNPSRTNVTTAMAGNYCVTATANGCTSAQSCTNVTISTIPPPGVPPNPTEPTANCGSATITRGGTPPTGVTWYWQGTTCGTSTTSGSGATFTAPSSGTYYIRARDNSTLQWSTACGSVAVNVTPVPSVTAGSNSPVDQGNTITLSANTISGATYSWTHSSGWTSNTQNPTRSSATAAMSGQYCVTATVNGCQSNQSCVTVGVNAPPTFTSCSSVCDQIEVVTPQNHQNNTYPRTGNFSSETTSQYAQTSALNMPRWPEFSWKPVLGATSYKLEIGNVNSERIQSYSGYSNQNDLLVASVPSSVTLVRISSPLSVDTDYTWKVIALNSSGTVIQCSPLMAFRTMSSFSGSSTTLGYPHGHFKNVICRENNESSTITQWECKEYIKRFMRETKKIAFMPSSNWYSIIDADYNTTGLPGLINAYPQYGITLFGNNGPDFPQVDDILFMTGHVAIIREVNSNSIRYIHQNTLTGNSSYHESANRAAQISGGNYLVSNPINNAPVNYWGRFQVADVFIVADNSSSLGYTELNSANFTTINNSTPTFAWRSVHSAAYDVVIDKRNGNCWNEVGSFPRKFHGVRFSDQQESYLNLQSGEYRVKVIATPSVGDVNYGTIESDYYYFRISPGASPAFEPLLALVQSYPALGSYVSNASISTYKDGAWTPPHRFKDKGFFVHESLADYDNIDSLRITAAGYESNVFTPSYEHSKECIPFFKASTQTDSVRNVTTWPVNGQFIHSQSTVMMRLEGINVSSVAKITSTFGAEGEGLASPVTTIYTNLPIYQQNGQVVFDLPIEEGFNHTDLAFIGSVDTVTMTKFLHYYQGNSMVENARTVNFSIQNPPVSYNVFVGEEFISERNDPSFSMRILNKPMRVRITAFGYQDKIVVVIPSQTNVTIALDPLNYVNPVDSLLYKLMDGTNFYKKSCTVGNVEGAENDSLFIRHLDGFDDLNLVPQSRTIEILNPYESIAVMKMAVALDQPNYLALDSIYLLRRLGDTTYSKIPLDDPNNFFCSYDSITQKLSIFGIPLFNSLTGSSDYRIQHTVMKRQAPIAIGPALSANEDETIAISIYDLFADPDSIPDDLTFNVTGNGSGITVQVVGDSIFITLDANYNGSTSIELEATHDWLTISQSIPIEVAPVNDAPVVGEQESLELCHGATIELNLNGQITDVDNAQPDISVQAVVESAVYPSLASDLSIGINGQTVSFSSASAAGGQYQVAIGANDGEDDSDSQLLNVTILPNPEYSFSQTICNDETFEGYSDPGVFTDVFDAANGCDSTRILSLNVLQVAYASITAEICEGANFENYTTAGNYTDVFTAVNGCDSIRNLNLAVWENPISTMQASICNGEDFEGYTNAGVFTDVFQSIHGCDSTRTLELTLNPLPIVSLGNDTAICNGTTLVLDAGEGFESYDWGFGQTTQEITVNDHGYYEVMVTDENGCIGTNGLNVDLLSFSPAPSIIVMPGSVLSSSYPTGNQWYLDGELLEDETGQQITPTSTGVYTVTYTNQNGCASPASGSISVMVGIGERGMENGLVVFPNPNSGTFTVRISTTDALTLKLMDAVGKTVAIRNVVNSSGMASEDFTGIASGVYLLEATTDGQRYVQRVIVN